MKTELFTLCFDKRLRTNIFRFVITGFFILIITIVVLLFLLVKFLEIQSKPDGFADNLKIPENIQISYPKNDGEEGDFGKPYAARFEVWFKPDTGGPEKKLIERNYIIEGWQR